MPLDGMRTALRELAGVPSRVSTKGAAAIERLWRATYRAGHDPYGSPWAKLAASTIRRKGHDRIMVETGATYAETRAKALPGVGIGLTTGYKAAWHMQATENRPARPVVPQHGLPATWRAKLRAISAREFKSAVRR
jgi:hypothetical protein